MTGDPARVLSGDPGQGHCESPAVNCGLARSEVSGALLTALGRSMDEENVVPALSIGDFVEIHGLQSAQPSPRDTVPRGGGWHRACALSSPAMGAKREHRLTFPLFVVPVPVPGS